MMAVITTTAGDEIVVEASGNPNSPVRMTVRERGPAGDSDRQEAEALLDEGSNDVLRSALMALWQETS